jgi:hypothetical protein
VDADESLEDTRMRVCRVLGELLASSDERPLSAVDAFAADETPPVGAHEDECAPAAPAVPGRFPNP